MLLSIVLLTGVFFFPLWQITLEAAQFPGGLKLNIWINKFSGNKDGGDIIKNINILNHYIGMRPIEPNAIPELKYFPFVVFGMMGLGGIAMWINQVYSYTTWFALMAILGILGIYDFYLWMYSYGHDLDPNAPIKIEGMSYTPPLFGEKDLLNFYVTSYPNLGTIFLSISVVLSLLAAWYANKTKHEEHSQIERIS